MCGGRSCVSHVNVFLFTDTVGSIINRTLPVLKLLRTFADCKYVNELLRLLSYNMNKLPLTETEMFGPVKGFVLG